MIVPTSFRTEGLVLAGAALLGAGVYLLVWLRRKSPEQIERERRQRLHRIGRIIDGTILEVTDLPVVDRKGRETGTTMQLLIYRYDVGGVQYEASQDVTHLRHRVDLHTCRIGLPTSVRYDFQNPANSIVISEDWDGLRD
jgi:hypothetical protein